MNLQKLFEAQAILDADIEKHHPVQNGEDRLNKNILALLVELGECANEWRGFKYWSNDQEPRNYCKSCMLIETPHEHSNPLLEEYVDCLHFILSIGHYLKRNEWFSPEIREKNITEQFTTVMSYALGLYDDDYFSELVSSFTVLGEMLGFTWEQIEQAYFDKNKINHQRQETGY